jgi:ABC-type uncharacterized transport system substrate-binding protein
MAPDAIFVSTNAALAHYYRGTRTVPTVFAQIPDPIAAGFVTNIAPPGTAAS